MNGQIYMIIALSAGLAAAVFLCLFLLWRGRGGGAPNPAATLNAVTQQQAELAGRLTQLAEQQEKASGELNRTLAERLDKVSKNVTDNLREAGEKTGKTLGDLGERLATIDKAQAEITALSGHVVELQHILDNKQSRGAFGESQLADIVKDGLPEKAYRLQHTLSNGKRVDCLINLPNPPGPVAVDSKFPLEAYKQFKASEDEAAQARALKQLGTDTLKHAQAIGDKYILTGETGDAALMFLPSESIFSELHLRLPEVIDKCRALRVYPVSPNTMSLTLNTVRAIMRDVKMREQAGLIQKEVHTLLDDVSRLNERVEKLRTHFTQADKDIGDIETSSRKITQRGDKITSLELDAPKEKQTRPDLIAD